MLWPSVPATCQCVAGDVTLLTPCPQPPCSTSVARCPSVATAFQCQLCHSQPPPSPCSTAGPLHAEGDQREQVAAPNPDAMMQGRAFPKPVVPNKPSQPSWHPEHSSCSSPTSSYWNPAPGELLPRRHTVGRDGIVHALLLLSKEDTSPGLPALSSC